MTREYFIEQRNYLKNLIMDFVANEYDEYEDADEGTIHTPSWDINSILDYVEDHLDTEEDRPLTRQEELLYKCIAYIEEVVNDYRESLDVFRQLGFTEQEMVDYEIRDFDLEDELNGTTRDKEEVCGFDKEDALRQRWGE